MWLNIDMDVSANILDEIRKHDLDAFKRLDAGHNGVAMAIEFLEANAYQNMAMRLRQMAIDGRIRLGPLEGFVAAGVVLSGGDFILLSDFYPEYATASEIMASLIGEIGVFKEFGRSSQENDERCEKALVWAKQRLNKPRGKSILAKAIEKTQGNPKTNLIDVLLEEQLITQEQLTDAQQKQSGSKKKPLQDVLVEMGFVSNDQIAEVFSKILEMPLFEINTETVDSEIVKLLKPDLLSRYSVYPVKIDNGKLILAMSNPRDLRALEEIGWIINMPIAPVLVSRTEILKKLDGTHVNDEAINNLIDNVAQVSVIQELKPVEEVTASMPLENKPTVELKALGIPEFKPPDEANAQEIMIDMEKKEKHILPTANMPLEYQMLLQSESPTVKLVNLVLSDAIKARASDVHLEPREQSIDVRYRIDGDLKNILQVPMKFHPKIVARVKILSNLDITQNMSPQDGRIQLMLDNRKIDFRVSTVPTFYGEKVVIRILDSQAAKVDLDVLGFDPKEKELFVDAVKSPQGMVLVTGPTGSGKTSTLYAALNFVKNESTNIVTIEDPIEFINEGINQIQVNPGRGVTFASGLRSILRQDPNVILVGEIRDKETADIALKASITGHLLLSTLHTNSCVATITRLADIGMEYFQIASALILVVSQRLVKTICPNCKAEYVPDENFKQQFADEIKHYKIEKLFKGKGCAQCNFSGYKGRIAVFEALKITESLKNVIARGAPEEEIYKEAYKNGFKRLMDQGIEKAITGVTTLEEVVKHLGNVEKEKESKAAEDTPQAPSLDPNRKRKILLVDDEDDIRKILGKYLQMGGYEVIQAVNGKEAIEKAIKEKPDLIITDLMMPVMDGLEEVKILRSSMETAVIPIIMLTARQDKESELSGINAGADDYMTKPFDKDKLLARVGMLLKRESLHHA
jgi:type IV pilus assembly protein PilB